MIRRFFTENSAKIAVLLAFTNILSFIAWVYRPDTRAAFDFQRVISTLNQYYHLEGGAHEVLNISFKLMEEKDQLAARVRSGGIEPYRAVNVEDMNIREENNRYVFSAAGRVEQNFNPDTLSPQKIRATVRWSGEFETRTQMLIRSDIHYTNISSR